MTAVSKQAITPSFTAKEIFKVNEERSFVIVSEIGFANIRLGLTGILSVFYPEFRLAAATSGGLYFGFAECLHFFNKNKNREEVFAMLSYYFIFVVLMVLLIINIFSY